MSDDRQNDPGRDAPAQDEPTDVRAAQAELAERGRAVEAEAPSDQLSSGRERLFE